MRCIIELDPYSWERWILEPNTKNWAACEYHKVGLDSIYSRRKCWSTEANYENLIIIELSLFEWSRNTILQEMKVTHLFEAEQLMLLRLQLLLRLLRLLMVVNLSSCRWRLWLSRRDKSWPRRDRGRRWCHLQKTSFELIQWKLVHPFNTLDMFIKVIWDSLDYF